MNDYPVTFFTAGRRFKWFIASRYPDGIVRTEAGPFWRWETAERIKQEFVRHFRNGFDMGKSADEIERQADEKATYCPAIDAH